MHLTNLFIPTFKVCGDCLDSMNIIAKRHRQCPTCRQEWTPYKNAFAKAYLEVQYKTLTLNCRHYGCAFKGTAKAVAIHRLYCMKRIVICPAVFHKKCNWRGPFDTLVNHIKEKVCCHFMIDKALKKDEDADKISFKGILQECRYSTLSNSASHRALRPIAALNASTFRIFPFLQIERVPGGRWQFHCWALLNKKALEGMVACIAIKTRNSKVFSAQFPILPLLSMNRIDAALEGNIFDLFDVHIVPENPTGNKLFEYEI